jgi:hypothetical protein
MPRRRTSGQWMATSSISMCVQMESVHDTVAQGRAVDDEQWQGVCGQTTSGEGHGMMAEQQQHARSDDKQA